MVPWGTHLSKSSKPLSGRYLSFIEREEIAILRAQGHGVCEIARKVERSASTISRELRRNAAIRSGRLDYRATTAQWHADRSARRPKPAKLATNDALKHYVQDQLAGRIVAFNGVAIEGPDVTWKGRRTGPRQHRRWSTACCRSRLPVVCVSTFPTIRPHDEEVGASVTKPSIRRCTYKDGERCATSWPPACARDAYWVSRELAAADEANPSSILRS